MPNAQLTRSQAGVLGLVLLALAVGLTVAEGGRWRALAPFSREAGVIALLYALWQLVGTLSEHGSHGAFARGRWIQHTERAFHLPAERDLQAPLLEHPWLGQTANIYYATMHFGALYALLLWVFWRHRERYPAVRTAIIGFTGLALLIQFLPVAPPRLFPEFGFTDVASHYGQSVYAIGGVSVDQLSAMPSVHVGWAVLVGAVVVWLGSGPWRYLALVHSAATVYFVTATANHWWLDGIVAIGLLVLVVGVQLAVTRVLARRRAPLNVPQPVAA